MTSPLPPRPPRPPLPPLPPLWPPSTRHAWPLLACLLALGALPLLAADPPSQAPAPALGTLAPLATIDLATLHRWQAQLLELPRSAGLLMILAAGLPLFFGWTLVRLCSASTLAAAAGFATWQLLAPHTGPGLLWGAVAVAGLLAGVVGWFLYQILIALKGASLLGLACFVLAQQSLPASLQAPWNQLVLMAASVAGAALGALAGWRLAPWLAILETTLIGTALAACGVIALAKPGGDTQTLLVAGLIALAALPAGLLVQARRELKRGT